jgi:NCS1 nucleoside transporter family
MYIPMLPTVFVFIAFIGVATTSAGQVKYGVIEWDPTALIALWDSRAARFFGAFSFALAALGVNISANSISAANDLAALAPKYINIRRGQLIVAICAWAIVPWKILESATTFLNFMAAYCVFIAPIAAIIVMDFFVVQKRKYSLPDLYNPNGIYKYRYDVNWCSFVAFFVAIAPVMPGFINSVNGQIYVGSGVYPYKFAWLLGFFVASGVYIALSLIFKAHGTSIDQAILLESLEVATDVILISRSTDGDSKYGGKQ